MTDQVPACRNGKVAFINSNELAELAVLRIEIERILTESLHRSWKEVSESEDWDTFDTSEPQSSLLSGDEADVSTNFMPDDLDSCLHTAAFHPLAGEELSPDELELYRNTFELGWGDDDDFDSEDSSRYGAISGSEIDGNELDLYRQTFEEGWE